MTDAYEILREEEIADIQSKGVLLRHKKTGAHIALLINDDSNKVFNIAFRTPPQNSTGVAHIIEHTVLCGSKKFPLKDPFVELAKGSLNTFLNAITYPDKTMYPVASCNDTDFRNLMEVYLDAVFYPNIYQTEKIFRQEGWHYHLESEDAPLTYNGVVYNEMKGAFSSAESVLERAVFNALFPDTPYGVESGGDPDCIPDLTYEEYLDFHRTWYHPSNSYLFLYGNVDMEERLDFIDREYLSRFDYREIDSSIPYQKPFSRRRTLEEAYPVLEDESLEENTYLNLSIVTGNGLDVETATAFNVLTYALLSSPGAPVRQALLDAGIGKDVSGSYNDGLLQHFLSIDAKYADASQKEDFERVIFETLSRIAAEGVDEKALRAALHLYEFRFREADFSSYPKGLIYGMNMFDSWLYDENRPFDYLKQLSVFDSLKAKIGTGYYEELIRKNLLENPHSVLLTLVPKRGLAAQKEKELEEKLAAYKSSLGEAEIRRIAAETKELQEYQEEEDSPEAVQSLPMLSISDIDSKTPIRLKTEEKMFRGVRILHHSYDTRGISYLTLLFPADGISSEKLPYLSLLKSMLGYVDTEHYSYSDLFNEINAGTGGIDCGLQVFPTGDGEMKCYFGIRSKYLDSECDFALSMMEEILFSSLFEDEKRMFEIISSQKSQYQSYIPAAGHISAIGRASAGLSKMAAWQEQISGIAYYRFLEGLYHHFAEKKYEMKAQFRTLMRQVFTRENMLISITALPEGEAALEKGIDRILEKLPAAPTEKSSYLWEPETKKEGILTSGQVQYVASVGNFLEKGYSYTGALRILKTILNYEYLWMNLRVKGGAYGCMSGFKRTGDAYLVSYRDPHLKNTLDVYEGLPAFAAGFEADERTMTKYIIGTVSELDTPMNAKAQGALALNAWFAHLTEEEFQKERTEILSAGQDSIRNLAPLLTDTFDGRHICVVGSEAEIRKHEAVFDHVETLVQG